MKHIKSDIIESLKSFADPVRREQGKNYHPTSMKILGVSSPNQKKVLKEIKNTTINFSENDKIELAKLLVYSDIFECQCVAYEFLGKNSETFYSITKNDINDLMINLDNWVSVDVFSIHISGKAWRNNILSNDDIIQIYNSEDFWRRRVAIVSTIPLNLKAQGGKGDTKRTLDICKLAIDDHHDLINKAMSWALRELSKTDKFAVELFLEKYQSRLNKRIKREVYNKLITGKKNII